MSFVSEMHTAAVEAEAATYTATFELGDDGWWAAQVVEVPEAISQGRTLDEARENVADALALALDLRVREGREIPSAGRVAIAPVTPAR
jgi:predicted RNase H-like HicB family nuclease